MVRPGPKCWIVERTLSWLHQFRRLRTPHDRRADLHGAFLSIASYLMCWPTLNHGSIQALLGLKHGFAREVGGLRLEGDGIPTFANLPQVLVPDHEIGVFTAF